MEEGEGQRTIDAVCCSSSHYKGADAETSVHLLSLRLRSESLLAAVRAPGPGKPGALHESARPRIHWPHKREAVQQRTVQPEVPGAFSYLAPGLGFRVAPLAYNGR